MKLSILSLLLTATAVAAVPAPKFSLNGLEGDIEAKVGELRARTVARRSTLTVPETDALVFATPQNDNNDGLIPLFGPDLLDSLAAANYTITACEAIWAGGFCEGAFSRLFKAICPISCEEDPALFCVQDDALASSYAGFINLKIPDSSSCAAMMGNTQVIVHPDNKDFMFCEHPALGLLCADTCNVNCWSWPPPLTTKAYLPGCKENVAVPKEYYKAMLKNSASPGDSNICPPPYLD